MLVNRRLRFAVLLVAVVAVLVQVDWVLGSRVQFELLPGFATMKFLTASLLLLLSISLWLALEAQPARSTVRGLGGVVLVAALVCLSGVIDERWALLLEPSMATSAMCALIGLNLLLGTGSTKVRYVAALCAFLAALIGFGGFLGHAIGEEYLYRFAPFASMAPHTSLLGTTLAVVAIAGDPRLPTAMLLRDDGPAGTMLRGLLPTIPLIPVCLALILHFSRHLTEVNPYLDVAFVLTLLTGIIIVGTFLLALRVHNLDTRRRVAEAGQVASENVTERILEAIPTAVLVINDEGTIERANWGAESLFRTTPGGLIGVSVDALVPRAWRAGHAVLRAGYLQQATARTMGEGRALSALRLDGTEFPVSVGLRPIEMFDRAYVVTSVVDLSERFEYERALRDHAKELERSNAELEQFAFITSHDLQEPLRAIEGFGGRLLEEYGDRLDERGQSWLQHTVDGAHRMSQMIRDLLNYSRARTQELQFEEVEVAAALDVVLGELENVIEECGARITHDPLPRVNADATLLRQLLRNLISNALRYRSTRPPEIQLGCRPLASGWEFFLADNGIGIDPQHLSRIFAVFKRLHSRGHSDGSGIGLALCRSIVERHDGQIWATSEPGVGSRFYFTLPGAPATLPTTHLPGTDSSQ